MDEERMVVRQNLKEAMRGKSSCCRTNFTGTSSRSIHGKKSKYILDIVLLDTREKYKLA
jgi:hypothetical protein